MEPIRIIKRQAKKRMVIMVPESYENKDLEITILPIIKSKSIKFDPSDFIGFMKHIEMDPLQESDKLRQEWDRDF
jgi:RNA-binding protein YlmH